MHAETDRSVSYIITAGPGLLKSEQQTAGEARGRENGNDPVADRMNAAIWMDRPATPTVLFSLESPAGFVIPGQELQLYGWSLASEEIVSRQLLLDGVVVSPVQYDLQRPDVQAAHPGFPGAMKCGFLAGVLPFPNKHGDTLAVTIVATLASGRTDRVTRDLRVLTGAGDILGAYREAGEIRPEALVEAAQLLSDNDYLDDAESIIAVAAMRFPDNLDILTEFASIETRAAASRYESGDEAVRRWGMARRCFPDSPALCMAEAKALITLHRISEAESLLISIGRKWPDMQEAEALYANLPTHRAHQSRIEDRRPFYVEAQSRWSAFRNRHPDHPVGYLLGADVHSACNEFSLAEALLLKAMDRFPDHWEAMARFAAMATMRGDSAEAMRRWKTARLRFPDMPPGMPWEERAHNEMLTEREPADERARSPQALRHTASASLASASGLPDRELVMMFEGLGSSCDFGAVQRHFGAEPLGLLRFASVALDKLIIALNTRFEGIGAPENTIFELREHPQPEYWLGDRRFNFFMHTFIFPEHLPTDEQKHEVFEKNCRRLAYLAEMLVLDLENAEKILVFQHHLKIADPEIKTLFRAVRKYGPNTLLCVGPSDAEHTPGSVEIVEPGLMRGHLKSFNVPGFGDHLDIENWQKVCRQAYVLRQSTFDESPNGMGDQQIHTVEDVKP
jgi:tetratricopeptide (TPR) repeat protein